MPDLLDSIRPRVASHRDAIVSFLRDIVAIPSHDSNIRDVAARVERELRALGFDAIHYAPYGDIVAKIGNGARILLYDSHLDTVGVGDAREWTHNPFGGEIVDGIMYGRGTVDEKGSTPAMIYGLKIAHDLGWLDGITAYYFGSIEEWCEGLSARVFAEEEKTKPDFVVIGEPTNLRVYRGHKGRCEIRVAARGKSAHGASHWLGENAIYKMQELLAKIPELDARLPNDPFLGRGSICATAIGARGGSNNVVPDRCEIILDRRLTFGETAQDALDQVRALVGGRADFEIEILKYDKPSYNGYRRAVEQIFPAWAFDASHPFVRAAVDASRAMGLETTTGKWNFSTNGAYWAGSAQIPSVGFGPGDENLAHIVDEHVRVDDVLRAAEWYALLPQMIRTRVNTGGAK
ncbi:MAG: YgeY family selenium metabolism-linked hydrolase [Chloroflexi bacterium]|nr:YgeY family selenium metabolism-linked hydrolase [Chloroflexota bacterium]